LSLNAEKNWVQNSGAKRRDVIRLSDIEVIPLSRRDCSVYVLQCPDWPVGLERTGLRC
jgi:hypothetical protein